jgi:hypothetical protein
MVVQQEIWTVQVVVLVAVAVEVMFKVAVEEMALAEATLRQE